MRTRLIVLPGPTIIVVGVWMLIRNRAQNGVCSATFATTSSSALNRVCMRVVLSYFVSFAFISAGLIVTVLTLTMLHRAGKGFRRVMRGEIEAVPESWGTPPPLHR